MSSIASDPKNSCWVFASAGSGKTKILVDRVVRLLLADVSPNKILCLTFTKSAAAEMQERINSRLAEFVLLTDDELKEKLFDLTGAHPSGELLKKARRIFVKILDSEARMKVQTIHSFCQSLIKIFPFEAKVKPGFEVLEAAQEKLLLEQAIKETIRDENLRELVREISGKLNEEGVAGLLSTLLEKKEKLIFENEEIFRKLSLSPRANAEEIFEKFLAKINREEVLQLVSGLEQGGSRNLEFAEKIKKFFAATKVENFSIYQSAFFTQGNSPRKISGKNAEELTVIALKQCELIEEFREELNSLSIAKDTILLVSFAKCVLQNYEKLKSRHAYLDYDDLIIETNRLLANPDFADWVKMKMDGSFDHILIDESQDTNRQQWSIIKALCEDFFSGFSLSEKQRSIFIVGDEKQSIFSFQGAEPNISSEIFAYFQKKFGEQFKKIELHHSFRSKAEILAAVDRTFSDPQKKSAISKASEFSGHLAIRSGKGLVEIWPRIQKEDEEREEGYEWKINYQKTEQNGQEILAGIVAAKIDSWVSAKRVNYGDIMILLRTRTNGFFDELVKSFSGYKIPFTSTARFKFSENLLIQDLLAAARFVLLPQDDLNLACLLKSPLFAFSEDDLLKICLKKNADKNTIYQALEGSNVRDNLDELIKRSQQMNAFEFFYSLPYPSDETLNKFLGIVGNFCQNSSPNLQKFLEFVDKIDPEISLAGEEDNRVRIGTVHYSKGLQAKIVLLPDCCFDLNKFPSNQGKIFWIDDLPFWCVKTANENSLIKQCRQIRAQEILEEHLRLLYVAMTRAEDELYLGGFGKATDPECWYEIVSKALPECVVEISPSARRGLPTPSSGSVLKKDMNMWTGSRDPVQRSERSGDKGVLVHKILEVFGKNHHEDKKWLASLAQKIVAREEFLSEKEKTEIIDLTINFLASKQFDQIFSGQIKCEVELVGKGTLKRIDLLREKENEILIVDYKSDETVPAKVPQQYLNQLKLYEELVGKINPDKKISSAILWVRDLTLQKT